MKTKYLNTIFLEVFFIILVAIIIISSKNLPEASSRLPLAVSYVTIILLLVQAGIDLTKKDEDPEPVECGEIAKVNSVKVFGSIFIMLLSVLSWRILGFISGSIITINCFGYFLGYKNFKILIIISVALSLSLYCVFKVLLNVPLPVGILI